MFTPRIEEISGGFQAQMVSPELEVRIHPLFTPKGEAFYSRKAAEYIADSHCNTANESGLSTFDELLNKGMSVVQL